MMFYLIGKKLGMTQLFQDNGEAVPVTVIEAGPCEVVQVKTEKDDRYKAVQLGFMDKKEKNVTKPLLGHFKKAGVSPKRHLKESRIEEGSDYAVGQVVKVDVFAKGDYVDVIGVTKGKGFAGGMKRHNFKGGRATHGSKFHRDIGGTSMSSSPARTFKGTRMAGHMGNEKHTVQNLKVVRVDEEMQVLMVRGAIPGPAQSVVIVKKAIKK